ncbi:MAG: SDR family NAD(P)-dependent oxidoreductase [Chloroflexi bacterium]|nr:SDR family NAD(P)-dependent oxidoreductase [Chloroflexota bacterium]
MTDLLNGRVAIVTGSGQGIGRAIAVALAAEGAAVVANNRSRGTPGGDAATTAGEITRRGGQAAAFFADVADYAAARDLVRFAVSRFGKLDILVTCAATIARKWIWDIKEEDWDRCVDVTLKGTFNCIRHACTVMKAAGWGRIINTASDAWLGTLGGADYSAAKGGVVSLTWCVARDLEKFGVTCNAFAPVARTRMITSEEAVAWNTLRSQAGPHALEAQRSIGVTPPPEAVAPLVTYLCTDAAASVSGQVFNITGGHIAVYSEPEERNQLDKDTGFWTLPEIAGVLPALLGRLP